MALHHPPREKRAGLSFPSLPFSRPPTPALDRVASRPSDAERFRRENSSRARYNWRRPSIDSSPSRARDFSVKERPIIAGNLNTGCRCFPREFARLLWRGRTRPNDARRARAKFASPRFLVNDHRPPAGHWLFRPGETSSFVTGKIARFRVNRPPEGETFPSRSKLGRRGRKRQRFLFQFTAARFDIDGGNF